MAAAWALAVVAIAIPDPHALQLWPFFPLGVIYVLKYALDWDIAGNGDAISAVGWLLYFVLTCSALLTSMRAVYFIIYAVLCALLLLNVVGCHMIYPIHM